MWDAGLGEAQAAINISRRNINNLKDADDKTTFMAESGEPLDESERGEWKSGLKTLHSKMKILPSSPITSWQIDEENMETVRDFIFLGSKITADGDWSHEIKRRLLLEKLWLT